MRVPLSWLKDHVDITLPLDRLADRLTLAGLEVDSITRIGETWDRDKLFVGQILAVARHPDADRLVLARVDYGAAEPLTVVTGAPNLYPYVGQDLSAGGPKCAFAVVGARLVDGHSAERKIATLKAGKIRGVISQGMICSEKELGLSDDHEGVLLLPADAPVGAALVDYLGDAILDFDIKGAFGHLQCVVGIGREVAALTGQQMRRDALTILERQPVAIIPDADFTGIVIEDPDLCLRYSAALIEGVTVAASPYWMQQRLIRAGMRPINNVVDVTNYVMLELGQPLHAFDHDLLRQRAGGGRPTIIMRRAHPGERLQTLDGAYRDLDPDMLLITDTAGAIAVGGVMGGADTEVNAGTRTILLEAANFHFLSIRRTSQLLKLSSEAASRFGKQVDPELTVAALARAGQLLEELAGGKTRPVYGDLYPGKPQPKTIALDPAYVNRLLGVDVPVEEMVRILRALEFEVDEETRKQGDKETRKQGGEERDHPVTLSPRHPGTVSPDHRVTLSPRHPVTVSPDHPVTLSPSHPVTLSPCHPVTVSPCHRVTVPSHRLDVTIAADLVEEIGRIYGYDRMPHTLLEDELPPQRRNVALEGEEKVRDVLVGCGLDEVITYTLIDVRDELRLNAAGVARGAAAAADAAGPAETRYVTVLNPLAAERGHLRRTLMSGLLNTARSNLRFTDRVAIFELGRVFYPRPQEVLPAEPRRLSALLIGPREPQSWLPHDTGQLGFYDLKGIVETLLARLELKDIAWERGEHPATHGGRTARLLVGGTDVGIVGELHPLVRRAFDLPNATAAIMELDLDALLAGWGAAAPMADISTQPAIYEDVAVIVDEATPAAQVAGLIRQAGGKLLADVRLFDIYRGGQIPAGKKSLAYSLTFQALDRTLTDEDTRKLRGRIIGRLERELAAVLRA
jgi:phenylalanyl-tRNA synthetase beta chain